jgi:hypothetical protein
MSTNRQSKQSRKMNQTPVFEIPSIHFYLVFRSISRSKDQSGAGSDYGVMGSGPAVTIGVYGADDGDESAPKLPNNKPTPETKRKKRYEKILS